MNKKTKMWIGVAVVAAVAYYFWEKSAKDKTNDATAAAATPVAKAFVGADGKK